MHIEHRLNNCKGFALATLLISVMGSAAACEGLQEKAIQDLIAAARELSDFVSDDKDFLSLAKMRSEAQKEVNFEQAMQPIDFTEEEHRIDRYALGNVVIESNIKGGILRAEGSAYKVSRSCIVTAAHVLYRTPYQEMSEKNRAVYSGKITFVRGAGVEKEEIPASVFFQMTKKGDYRPLDNERMLRFYGASDLIILKLHNSSDGFYKTVKVVTPDQLLRGIDPSIGRKIVCMGSPSHMTRRNFGNCKGSEFKWKQVNARIFREDDSTRSLGVITNAALSSGSSGGACFLAEDTSQLIGLAVNIYDGNKMPNIIFTYEAYANQNAAHIATFHRLDARMKSELGYGLDEIDKHCK